MSTRGKLRTFGALIIFFNLWLIGNYNLTGLPVILLTFGFAAAYELVVVRLLAPADKR